MVQFVLDMGYKKDVIKGISWIGLLKFSTKAVGFLEAVILARILSPDQFGAYGVALLALGLLETLTETGVNIVLIQEQNVDTYVSSAWIVSMIRGTLIMILLFLVSPLISQFFHSPQSLILLNLICLVPFLRGFINPAVVKFQKDLLFGKDFWYRFVILIIDTVVSVTVTYITKQPIGIVIGLLAGVLVELLLSFFIVSPRPGFQFKKAYVSKIFHRGKWITASGVFDYLFFNTDNIAVGRLMGASSLGIYQLAYSLSVVPMTELSNVFVHVTFPVFTRISNDVVRLKKGFYQTLGVIFLLMLPLFILLTFLPHIFVLLLGTKWSALEPILPILGLLGVLKSLTGTSSVLFLSEKKQNYTTVTTLVNIVGMVIVIVPFVIHLGLRGAAFSGLFGTLLSVPVIFYYINKILGKQHVL